MAHVSHGHESGSAGGHTSKATKGARPFSPEPPAPLWCLVQLSPHFSLEELTRTDTGLENVPNAGEVFHLTALAAVLEQARQILGDVPLHINSGFRSLMVNSQVGGVHSSAHVDGRAADFVPIGVDLLDAFDLLRSTDSLPYDQIILEPSWIHLGIARDGDTPRRDQLVALPGGTYRRTA